MNESNPYRSPSTDKTAADTASDPKRPSRPATWIRLKRGAVFLLGLLMVAWSIFAGMKVLGREDHGGDAWLLYCCAGIICAIGLFLLYIAIRGTDDDIQDVG